MALTLKQAAKEVGLSKPAVLKAIQKGKISANKDENGRWKIEPAELFRVYPRRKPVNKVNDNQLTEGNDKVTSSLQVEVEILREKNKLQKERLEEIQEQRDQWREQANKLLLTYESDKKATLQKIENTPKEDTTIVWLMPFLTLIAMILITIALKAFNIL